MFRYFVPNPSVPSITADNLLKETLRETHTYKNMYLWRIKKEKKLQVWVNPNGVLNPALECYWWPRMEAKKLLDELEQSSDYIKYAAERQAIHNFITEAKALHRKDVSKVVPRSSIVRPHKPDMTGR